MIRPISPLLWCVENSVATKVDIATTQMGQQIPKDFSTDSFDAAILGGSIHMGNYPRYMKNFVLTHKDWLNQVPSALFTVCMAIHSVHEKEQNEARSFGPRFSNTTNWQPNLMETFAGAIKYTQYGFITRKIMQYIARKEGGSTDTSKDHEYTDWEAVTRFSERFISELDK